MLAASDVSAWVNLLTRARHCAKSIPPEIFVPPNGFVLLIHVIK